MTSSSHSLARTVSILAVSALAWGLSACDKAKEPPTIGQQIDSGVQSAERAAEDAKLKAERALQTTENKVAGAVDEAGSALSSTTRSAETMANDAAITARVSSELARDPELSAIKIDVDTQSGKVRLTGPAPNQAAKERAASLAKGVNGVVSVDNGLVAGQG